VQNADSAEHRLCKMQNAETLQNADTLQNAPVAQRWLTML